MKKKRVYIDGEVLVMPHFSGIGHYCLELFRALDAQLTDYPNLDVRMFVHFPHIDKARSYDFKNIKLIKSPFSLRISNGLKIRGKQPPLDLIFGPELYVFPNYSSWPLLFSKSVPFIYDLSFEKYPEFAEPRNQAFLSDQVKKSAKRASHIATISKNSKKEISMFYNTPLDHIGVYYPAVNTEVFHKRTNKEIKKVKNKYGILGQYILFVGNIEPRKNLKNLLLAYEKLDVSTRKNHPLLLVGAKGWQDGEIVEIIARLKSAGNTILRPSGYVNDADLPAIYSGASLFVYPSIYEGFGIPPIEAMACGVPVISSDNSSLPEAVGDAAKMVSAESVSELADAINVVLSSSSLQKDMISEGFKQVRRFSWPREAKKMIETLQNIVIS
ncbi:glycosyltransferase family 4 protein [Candidatus Saccharibacteria bacterium]|nr:MAG: glycosyltransferase family 4 protein [Candidatus Saccharibacteria bacterium]